ncbi:MAG: undecaprenyl-phosphate galactose phosphotransferase WbaP [Spirochaetaceae bacterium]|jgi:Undecaprenyl-phosphate galactose phosphotransferase WbaP|nr:undecaprenyl-phosphate galactose phosphotransferase WbaP [Spirochaetaceae bacterium]
MVPNEYSRWFKERYKHTSSFLEGLTLMVVDALGIMLCFGASFFIINLIDRSFINFRSFVSYWVYLPAFLAVFFASKLYPGIMPAPADEVRKLALASTCCFAGIALSITVETDNHDILGLAFLLAVPFAVVILPAARDLARKTLSRLPWWGVPAAVYVNDPDSFFVIDRLRNNPEFGYRPALILTTESDGGGYYNGIPIFTPGEEIHRVIGRLRITTAIIVERQNGAAGGESLGNDIMTLYRYTLLIPFARNLFTMSLTIRDLGGILAFASTHNLLRRMNLFCKRLMDLFLGLLILPAAVPVVALIALGVKATSPGPVFFGHDRIGLRGKPIRTWKFRSMVQDAEKRLKDVLDGDPAARDQWEKNRKIERDPRITAFGKFLRKTSLDELPQLWNILIGEMSFIGPRPVTEEELKKYGYKDKENFILSVKPGLSGLWQISGRSETGYEQRVLLDTYYIQNWSIWLDIWIMIQTVWVVVRGKGAY